MRLNSAMHEAIGVIGSIRPRPLLRKVSRFSVSSLVFHLLHHKLLLIKVAFHLLSKHKILLFQLSVRVPIRIAHLSGF